MGRPKLDNDKKRSEKFIFRVTDGEVRQLVQGAATCGMAPGTFVREKLLKGKFPQARTPRLDRDTYVELKRIGNNLNQLTKLAHLGKLSAALLPVLRQLSGQQEAIISLLINDSKPENR